MTSHSLLAAALLATGCATAPAGASGQPSAAPAPAASIEAAAASTAPAVDVAMGARPSATPKTGATPWVRPSGYPANWPAPCPEDAKGHVAGTVLVGFEPKLADDARAKFRTEFGVIAERAMLLPDAWVMRVPCDADIPALAKRMSTWPGVRYAEPDAIVTLDDPVPTP